MANETRLDDGADSRSIEPELDWGDESGVTRERLDGTPLSGWRARLAQPAEQLGAWFGASAEDDANTHVGRALSQRQKLTRGGIIVLVIALALAYALGGLNILQQGAHSAFSAAWSATHPTPALSAPGYQLQRLPAEVSLDSHGSLAPAIATPNTAYICWMNHTDSSKLASLEPTRTLVYATRDGGKNWSRLNAPVLIGQDCQIATDQTGEANVAMLIAQGDAATPCQTPLLYLSHNAGATWKAIPWPSFTTNNLCGLQITLASGAIYAWEAYSNYSISLLAGSLPANTSGDLIVTRDDGMSWDTADTGLGIATQVTLVGFRPGGRILATTPNTTGHPEAEQLLISADYGASWRNLGDVPGAFPTIYATTDPSVVSDGGWGQLYAIARPITNGQVAPETSFILETGTPGGHWTTLPAPPLKSATSNATNNLPIIMGIGPSGSLFVQRGVVASNDKSQEATPPYWVWVWSVHQHRWLEDTQPFPSNAYFFGWDWDRGTATEWLGAAQPDNSSALRLYTRTYTAASVH